MKITRLVGALAVLPLALSAVAADPVACRTVDPDGTAANGDEYELCTVETWFHRATTHATNAGFIEPSHGLATFDTTPPAGSVATGNGGGYAAAQLLGNDGDLTEAVFTGTVTGVVDTVDVDLNVLFSNEDVYSGTQTIAIDLIIGDDVYESFTEVEVPLVPEPNASAAKRMDFAITGLAGLFKDKSATAEHAVELRVRSHYTDVAAAFAFDTTEVPGGITFNPVTLEAGTLVVN